MQFMAGFMLAKFVLADLPRLVHARNPQEVEKVLSYWEAASTRREGYDIDS
jgi:hypothetical protein